jgi:hypothetical protein
MRKIFIIIAMLVYGLGNTCFLTLEDAHLFEMYQHCAQEDPDLTPLDFVVEHLMNIPDFLDAHELNEPHDQPHKSFVTLNVYQVAIMQANAWMPALNKPFQPLQQRVYPLQKSQALPDGIGTKMLRPPTV